MAELSDLPNCFRALKTLCRCFRVRKSDRCGGLTVTLEAMRLDQRFFCEQTDAAKPLQWRQGVKIDESEFVIPSCSQPETDDVV